MANSHPNQDVPSLHSTNTATSNLYSSHQEPLSPRRNPQWLIELGYPEIARPSDLLIVDDTPEWVTRRVRDYEDRYGVYNLHQELDRLEEIPEYSPYFNPALGRKVGEPVWRRSAGAAKVKEVRMQREDSADMMDLDELVGEEDVVDAGATKVMDIRLCHVHKQPTSAQTQSSKQMDLGQSTQDGTAIAESSKSPSETDKDIVNAEYTPLPLPEWYKNMSMTSHGMKELNKRPSSDQADTLTALSSMKTCITNCENETNPTKQLELFETLRDQIHKAEILLLVDRFIVRKAQMLYPPTGLPRIFTAQFPWDIKADAWQLYVRWHAQIFEVDLLRGIVSKKGKERNADSIDPKWTGKIKANYYGQGHLVLGQWWPTQLCAVRDGAHGASQGGIWGEKGMGAYSIVLSNGGVAGGGSYSDEDNGTEIWYSGTEGKNFTPTEFTLRLIETCDQVHNKVRVLRSHQLQKKNPYRPKVGLRYDGLYEVVAKKLTNKAKACYLFKLVRSKGQNPIRYEQNSAARRPTIYEIKADEQLRKSGRLVW
ncbi:hypothetical protein P280DRAFT_471524 [Massarina eburnea CBS 473.64]|uniref:YDG domain-containing protein n=1 Tax=Massarina eburnea CBS 473.64 TaxID=1395130 RepID=A0A6A6RVJ8_9PLEO|nr:hypothetical protein P280DRAFT_471524 [Massarina eburnea CBS 473.64]